MLLLLLLLNYTLLLLLLLLSIYYYYQLIIIIYYIYILFINIIEYEVFDYFNFPFSYRVFFSLIKIIIFFLNLYYFIIY